MDRIQLKINEGKGTTQKNGSFFALFLKTTFSLVFTLFLFSSFSSLAQAADIARYDGGVAVYADGTTGVPKYKVFNDATGFESEQSAMAVGGSVIEWLRVATSPIKNEWIIVTRDAADVIVAQVCNGIDGGLACGATTTITATAGTHGLRNFDVAYEQLSGDALLVYGTATADELRKIEWKDGAWTSDAAITTTRTTGTVEWVELTSRNASDQIGIAYSDSNDDVSAYRWSGTAVGNEATAVITATASTADLRKFDISFEGVSGDMIVAAPLASAGTTALGHMTAAGTWTIVANTEPDNITAYIDLQEPNPIDDDVAMIAHGSATSSNPTEGYELNGATPNTTTTGMVDGTVAVDTTTTVWATNYMMSSVAYLSSTYYAVAVFSDVTGADDINWWTMASTGVWTVRTDNLRVRGTIRFTDMFDYPNADKVLLFSSDSNSDLLVDSWDGATTTATAWTDRTGGVGAIETSLSSATTKVFDFAFRTAPYTFNGVLYEADGVTPYSTSTPIKIAVATGTVSIYNATTTTSTGAFILDVPVGDVATGTPLTIFSDNSGAIKAVTVTKTSGTSTVSNLDLYKDHVIIRNEGGSGTTTKASDLVRYDSTNDADIQFTASSTLGRLTVADGQTLLVASGTTFHMDLPTVTGSFKTATTATTLAYSPLTLSGNYTNNGTFQTADASSSEWIARSAAGDDDWRSVTYGNGLFVAVGSGPDRVMTSPDGITWTPQTAAEANTWNSVTYGNGKFVAVSSNGTNRVMTSSDGVTWATSSAAQANFWNSVTYGNGLFVAISSSGANRVMTSSDGVTWTAQTSSVTNGISITYGNGLFVALSKSKFGFGAKVTYSSNGTSWTDASTTIDENNWTSVTYGNGLFVALSSGGTNQIITSSDGNTWTNQVVAEANFWNSVTYGNGLFVSVGSSGNNRTMTSPDGTNWTARSAAGDDDYWQSVTYGNGLFVAVGSGPDRVMTSSDGYFPITLNGTSAQTLSGTMVATSTLPNLIFAGSGTKTFSNNASTSAITIATSSGAVTAPTTLSIAGDFTNSSTFNAPTDLYMSGANQSATGTITGAPNLTIAGTGAKTFYTNASTTNLTVNSTFNAPTELSISGTYTNNGTSTYAGGIWTARSAAGDDDSWNSVTYGNGLFVAVGSGPDRVMTSPDGTNWTVRSAAGNNDSWYGITYGNGLFVAVGSSGDRVMTSPDGTNWTARSAAGDDDSWNSVTYGNGLFVAVGSGPDRVMTSLDGTNWTARSAAGNDDYWQSVTYGSGLFVAVGSGLDRVMTSPDGTNWTVRSAAGNNDSWQSVTYGNGLFVAVGSSGDRVMTSPFSITTFSGASAQTLSGGMTGANAFGNVAFTGAGTKTFNNNASAVNFSVVSTSSTVVAPSQLTVLGNYSNNGTFTAGSGTTTFSNATDIQNISGNLTGASAFNNVEFIGTTTLAVTDDLIGYWNFDNANAVWSSPTAATFYDTSGYGNNGSAVNMASSTSSITGKIGQGIAFDGTNDYINIPDSETFTMGTSSVTIAAWFKFNDAASTSYQFIVSQAVDAFELNKSSTGNLRMEIKYDNETNKRAYETTASLTEPNRWYHVVGVFTPTTGAFQLYVDGASRAVTYVDAQASGTIKNSINPVYIGYRDGGYMNGSVDEVRIYKRALGATDVSNLYNEKAKLFNNNASTSNFIINSGLVVAPGALTVSGNYSNSGNYRAGLGTINFASTTAQTLSGNMVASSTFANVNFSGASTKTFANNASTTDLTIANSTTVVAPAVLQVGGKYQNNGTFTNSSGKVIFGNKASTIGTYTGVNFGTSGSGNNNPTNSVFAEGYLWIADQSQDKVYKYYADGTYTGVNFSTSAGGGATDPHGITYDGEHFWISDFNQNKVFKYALDGTYTGFNFSVTDAGVGGTPYGITYAFGHLWITSDNQDEVYEFNTDGTYTGFSFDTAVAGSNLPNGLTYALGYFWVPDWSVSKVYQFTSGGVYTGFYFGSGSTISGPTGIAYVDGYFLVNSYTNKTVYQFTAANQIISGNLSGSSAFKDVEFNGSSTKGFTSTVETDNLTIKSDSGAVVAPTSTLSISGNYLNSNSYAFISNGGTTTFSGTSAQTASGTMTGVSSLGNVSLTGAGTKTFNNIASTSNLYINTTATTTFTNSLDVKGNLTAEAGAKLALAESATTTVSGNLTLLGASTTPILLVSETPGQTANFALMGTASASYTTIKDSNACGSVGGVIDVSSGNNTNGGNTTCWSFISLNPVLSFDTNQQFYVGQATTTLGALTITDAGTPTITSANDIRLTIATGTTNFRFDTGTTNLNFTGTASGKVSGTVSYEDSGATLVVNVTTNFAADDTLIINGIKVGSFASISTTTSQLALGTDGNSTGTPATLSDKTIRITGGLLATDHSAGQVSNKFNYQNKTDEALFAFNLQAVGENATVTDMVISLEGVQGVDSSKLNDFKLYRDNNGDRAIDGGDSLIDGAGILTINGQYGAITFSSDFLASSSVNYIMTADITGVSVDSAVYFKLQSIGISAIGATSLYTPVIVDTVSNVQHHRHLSGGGGSSARVGEDAPEGDGDVSGGGSGGGGGAGEEDDGENIATDPNYFRPTISGASDNQWTNGANGLLSDGVYATAASAALKQSYNGFSFGIPGTDTIQGLAVKLDVSGTTAAGTIDVSISWDSGNSYTTAKATPTLTGTDVVYTVGGAADTWGRSWAVGDFAADKFILRVSAVPSSNTIRLDALEVRVFHQAGGGNPGGGGGI